MSTVAIQKFFFQGHWDRTLNVIGDSRESSESLSYPSRLGELGERRKLSSGVWGRAPAANDFLTFYMQFYATYKRLGIPIPDPFSQSRDSGLGNF